MAADAFQKFKSSVNRGIATISVKTSSSLEKSKIKTHIESLNRDIDNEIVAIGKSAYEIWTKGEIDFSSLNARFELVKSKYDEIEALNVQLSSIDERDNQILGNTAPVVEEPVQSAPKFICTNCGTQYDSPVNFCRKCGNKMEI